MHRVEKDLGHNPGPAKMIFQSIPFGPAVFYQDGEHLVNMGITGRRRWRNYLRDFFQFFG